MADDFVEQPGMSENKILLHPRTKQIKRSTKVKTKENPLWLSLCVSVCVCDHVCLCVSVYVRVCKDVTVLLFYVCPPFPFGQKAKMMYYIRFFRFCIWWRCPSILGVQSRKQVADTYMTDQEIYLTIRNSK